MRYVQTIMIPIFTLTPWVSRACTQNGPPLYSHPIAQEPDPYLEQQLLELDFDLKPLLLELGLDC